MGSYAFPLLQPVEDKGPKSSPAYFVVNTDVPYKIAEESFKKQFEARQNGTRHSKRFDPAALAGWCDDGVLPYIDLKIFERIESDRRNNPHLSITDEELADAIYPASPARASTCVSDTTRPVATRLMNSTSSLFRSLLVAAGGRIQ